MTAPPTNVWVIGTGEVVLEIWTDQISAARAEARLKQIFSDLWVAEKPVDVAMAGCEEGRRR